MDILALAKVPTREFLDSSPVSNFDSLVENRLVITENVRSLSGLCSLSPIPSDFVINSSSLTMVVCKINGKNVQHNIELDGQEGSAYWFQGALYEG